MNNSGSYQDRIKKKYNNLSVSQKALAKYIINNRDKAAFLTASQLGALVGVSESTVIRFAVILGYLGYPELQRNVQKELQDRINMVSRFQETDSMFKKANPAYEIIRNDISNMEVTINNLDVESFNTAVDELCRADRIYIVAQRSAYCLAEFFGFYLQLLKKDIRVVPQGISSIFEQLMAVKKDDLVIGIGFPRYARCTVEGMEFASKKGAHTLAITDSILSPLVQNSRTAIIVESDLYSFIQSLTVPMSIINALVTEVGRKQKEETIDTLMQLEIIWKEYNIYYLLNENSSKN